MTTEPPDVRVPGGWESRRLRLGNREVVFWAPADPEAFLDDAEIVAAHGPTNENPGRSDIPFWQYVWPSAEHMAGLVFAHKWSSEVFGFKEPLTALELGAGVGLVGLAGLAAGLVVTFSDYQEPALKVARVNARRNGFSRFETQLLDWNAPESEQFPIIFGCDVVYERAIHQPILDVLDQMLLPGGVAWLGDPGRAWLPMFIEAAESRAYAVEIQNAQGRVIPEFSAGEFQLLTLSVS